MASLVFDSPFDFYDLSEDERVRLIGSVFRVREFIFKGKNNDKIVYTDNICGDLFIPVGLASDEFNYGVEQGVLVVTTIRRKLMSGVKCNKWFKVGVFSPDDLDMDLEFTGDDTSIRQDVVEFIRWSMCKRGRRYREMLEQIVDEFECGEIWL